ncbi:LytTR family DNA-binding domain-containing protein [Streptococcus oricebi]|uniref:LytTR family transcriptional regulator n=1 Tax=Streptococcus oricebi TaxID=1547447 RepID=A0ABS5B5H5_9STRE|nr:LytTR family DNA-binding domain-containing protein [Streptococcus oricebi]MBP2624059.1 LytTR family transcriptional regulator [Streptococcus oricebi]
MKIRLELDQSLTEVEVVIKTARLDSQIEQIQRALEQATAPPLIFYKGSSEFFIDLDKILFFETDGTKIYGHTLDNAYEVRLKLYELEERLPYYFCRISKSTIANSKAIYSLEKSFSGTSSIRFYETHKEVHVSRHYYQFLKEKLNETR